nr:TPA_asm: hypothetical protein [Candastroli virus 2]
MLPCVGWAGFILHEFRMLIFGATVLLGTTMVFIRCVYYIYTRKVRDRICQAVTALGGTSEMVDKWGKKALYMLVAWKLVKILAKKMKKGEREYESLRSKLTLLSECLSDVSIFFPALILIDPYASVYYMRFINATLASVKRLAGMSFEEFAQADFGDEAQLCGIDPVQQDILYRAVEGERTSTKMWKRIRRLWRSMSAGGISVVSTTRRGIGWITRKKSFRFAALAAAVTGIAWASRRYLRETTPNAGVKRYPRKVNKPEGYTNDTDDDACLEEKDSKAKREICVMSDSEVGESSLQYTNGRRRRYRRARAALRSQEARIASSPMLKHVPKITRAVLAATQNGKRIGNVFRVKSYLVTVKHVWNQMDGVEIDGEIISVGKEQLLWETSAEDGVLAFSCQEAIVNRPAVGVGSLTAPVNGFVVAIHPEDGDHQVTSGFVDPKGTHACTTTSGCSGAPVFGNTSSVIGVHAGRQGNNNYFYPISDFPKSGLVGSSV